MSVHTICSYIAVVCFNLRTRIGCNLAKTMNYMEKRRSPIYSENETFNSGFSVERELMDALPIDNEPLAETSPDAAFNRSDNKSFCVIECETEREFPPEVDTPGCGGPW